MGKKLPPDQLKLYQMCDEVLHYIWDPIGVAGYPGARDEYHAYLPHVFRLVLDDAGKDTIIDYLVSVETDRMGMRPNRARAERAAVALLEWHDWITSEAP